MRTLVVEDDEDMRGLLEGLLEARGFDPTAYADAEHALAAYDADPFDLVIIDRYLPRMDGLELCRRIRGMPGGAWSTILVCTAAHRPQDLNEALDAGADDYMTKPFHTDFLNVRLTIAKAQVENRQGLRTAEHERDEARRALEASRDDMLSILNHLAVGTAITNTEGHVTYMNEAAQRLFQTAQDEALDQRWDEVFPLRPAETARLRRIMRLPEAERGRVPARVDTRDGKTFWMEIDVKDDPRDAQRKVFVLNDVTEIEEIRRQYGTGSFQELVGRSEEMQTVFQMIRELARVDSTVLLEGETGTGKELVARALHRSSPRHDGAFIAVNCAGLPESLVSSLLFGHRRGAFTGAVEDRKGVFESAHGGTIFLDEIGDIPPSVQTVLLRVLQEREVTRLGETQARKIDVRVLAATHHDLGALVEEGRFRMDLLYRIRIARIFIPPLRQRRKDVPLLAGHFLDAIAPAVGKGAHELAPETVQVLMGYAWPGNVRELRGAIEYALLRAASAVIQPRDLPPEILDSFKNSVRLGGDPFDEKARVLDALNRARGNRSRAATLLGVSRATFYRRLKNLGLDL